MFGGRVGERLGLLMANIMWGLLRLHGADCGLGVRHHTTGRLHRVVVFLLPQAEQSPLTCLRVDVPRRAVRG